MDAATAVVLLCHHPETGQHWRHFATRCYRVTPEELKELYLLSQVSNVVNRTY